MKNEINATNFIETWKKFTKKFEDDKGAFAKKYVELWQNDKTWTNEIIGEGNYEGKNSPLGEHILKNFKDDLKYRKEFYKLDLLVAKRGHFGIKDLDGKDFKLKQIGFYPTTSEIIIEHENKIERCWEEMYKLTCYKAKLKVLITYNYFEEVKDKNDEYFELICDNFKDIVKRTNQEIKEDARTEYLLIVGNTYMMNNLKHLKWKYKIIRNE